MEITRLVLDDTFRYLFYNIGNYRKIFPTE
jgi:hypothetical protein